ncbi:sigma-70 family RNA polymerase sigma factor [Sphingobacterium sp. N143]|nr:sigma-70 family RNA polymerase sigma factor [Sphingobacterium sp. N143]
MQAINNLNQSVERQKLFMQLYQRVFPIVARYVSKMGGSFEEAKDVFQDALVAYYEKIIVSPDALYNDSGYLVGTSKNLWLKRYKQKDLHGLPLDLNQSDVAIEDENSLSNKRLFRFLEMAGRKCMELLKAFYYDRMPLHEIADEFGYSGTRSATVQKYKCLEKVRNTVKEKALTYDDFMD